MEEEKNEKANLPPPPTLSVYDSTVMLRQAARRRNAMIPERQELGILNKVGTTNTMAHQRQEQEERLGCQKSLIPTRELLGFKSLSSITSSIHDDKTLLHVRSDWIQLLIREAFKPYTAMISTTDDNFPDKLDELLNNNSSQSSEDNFFSEDDNEALKEIRDEMLDDPDLTEREIAAYFEGYSLALVKANSLQTQLDGLKVVREADAKLHHASIFTRQRSSMTISSSINTIEVKQTEIIRDKKDEIDGLRDTVTTMCGKLRNLSVEPVEIGTEHDAIISLRETVYTNMPTEMLAEAIWRKERENSSLRKGIMKICEDAAENEKRIVRIEETRKNNTDHDLEERKECDVTDEEVVLRVSQVCGTTVTNRIRDLITKPQSRLTSKKLGTVDVASQTDPPVLVRDIRTQDTGVLESRNLDDPKQAERRREKLGEVNKSTLSDKNGKATGSMIGNEMSPYVQDLLEQLKDAEIRQKRLEKQLSQAGISVADDIPYEVAKQKVESIIARMGIIGSCDVSDPLLQAEYFKLEQDLEKYDTALVLTDEYAEQQEEEERRWEESVAPANEEAIRKIRRHMPVDVRNMSEAELHQHPTPNGKLLPKAMAKKFKRTNVLQILRINPDSIAPMHPSTLENMRVASLTLTERRALYHHLKDISLRWKAMQADKMTERKWMWFKMMKSNFKENVDVWQRHIDQYGPLDNHPYITRDDPNTGCPLLGRQCPLKADKVIDYDGDYGFPEDARYFEDEKPKKASSEVDSAAQAKEEARQVRLDRKSVARGAALKIHYKGNIMQISKATGSCELMDETMDKMELVQEKWIQDNLVGHCDGDGEAITAGDTKKQQVTLFNDTLKELKLSFLQFAEKSGMHLTGKRDANANQPDIRSIVELALCIEMIEMAEEFFTDVNERMEVIGAKDGRMTTTIHQLRQLLEELQDRNLGSIKALGEERPPQSRTFKTREAMFKTTGQEISREGTKGKREKMDAIDPSQRQTPTEIPGGLMAAIAAGRGKSHGRGGRGCDLMAAIAARNGGHGKGEGRGRGGRGEVEEKVVAEEVVVMVT